MSVPGLSQSTAELGTLRDGYPALASRIARDPDNEPFVFRKFDRLAARNLLQLQAQLIALEHEIDVQDEEARKSDETRQSSRRWETLVKNATDDAKPEKKRLEKFQELQIKIKEYHEALLLQTQIAQLESPSERVVSAIQDYMDGSALKISGFDKLPIISGRAKEFLSDPNDLVALHRVMDKDYLSQFLQNHWPFQKHTSTDPFDRTTTYKAGHVVRTVAAFSMAVAAVLLIGATTSLYFVTNAHARLGMIAGYTLLFALSMVLLTNAKKAEIYGATAAYAAVLVVFVSGNLGVSQQEQCLLQLASGVFKYIDCPS